MLIKILIIFIYFLVIDIEFFDSLGRFNFRGEGRNKVLSIRGRDRGWMGFGILWGFIKDLFGLGLRGYE